MFKKTVSWVVTAALLAGTVTLSGCGEKAVQETAEGGYTITWVGNANQPMEKDTPAEQYLEEMFNVNIDTISIPASNYVEKLGSMIASGETPDIMFLGEPEVWQPLAQQGALAEVPVDRIQKYAPNYYQWVTEFEPNIFAISNIDGVNWVIPKVAGTEYNTSVIWRGDWLEKLGITKTPDTIEEFEEAFTKIRNEDPDGNGQKDTYGFTGLGGHPVRQFDMIFGAYGIMPGQWNVEDGQVINGTINDKSKEVLMLLNDWYKKELIDPEFITDNLTTASQKFESGRLAIRTDAVSSWIPSMPVGKTNLEAWAERDPNAKFQIGSIPAGPDGDRGDWLWGPRSNFVGFGAQLEDDPEKLNYILQMLDKMVSDEEVALRLTWGELGKEYDYNDPEVGASSGLKYLPPYDSDANERAKAGIGQFGFFNQLTPLVGFAINGISDKYNPQDYTEHNEKYANYKSCQDALLRPGLASTSQYSGNLDKVKTAAYSEFITGVRSFDEWEAFKQEWLSQGGEQLTKEAQAFYEANFKK